MAPAAPETRMFKTIAAIALFSLPLASAWAGEADFYGKWKITGAVEAPWEDPAHPMVTDDVERYAGQVVEISAGRMAGPDLLGCGATDFSIDALPYAGLFEGGLGVDPGNPAAPYDEARARRLAEGLGYRAEPVESLSQGCSEIILHRMNGTMLQFALDNRIFSLERQ